MSYNDYSEPEEWVGPFSLASILIQDPSAIYEDPSLPEISRLEQALKYSREDAQVIESDLRHYDIEKKSTRQMIEDGILCLGYLLLGAGATYGVYALEPHMNPVRWWDYQSFIPAAITAIAFISWATARESILEHAEMKLHRYSDSLHEELKNKRKQGC